MMSDMNHESEFILEKLFITEEFAKSIGNNTSGVLLNSGIDS